MTQSSNTPTKQRELMSAIQAKELMSANFNSSYDGERVMNEQGSVFLLLNGELRGIPDPTTYNNLFTTWDGISKVPGLIQYTPVGVNIFHDAKILKGNASDATYLVTNNVKMYIGSPDVMRKFSFVDPTVIPQIAMDSIPNGPGVN